MNKSTGVGVKFAKAFHSHVCISDVSECLFVLKMQVFHFSVWSIVSIVSMGCAVILIDAILLPYTVEASGQYFSCRNLQKRMKQSKKEDSSSLLSLAYKKELFSKLLKRMCRRILLQLEMKQ